jgi:carboxyl-terminal processing protease
MPWIRNAPVFLVFCGDPRRLERIGELRGHQYKNGTLEGFFNAAVDAALVMQTLILAAETAGLGCCPISVIRNHAAAVGEILELPEKVFPVAGLCVGYPAVGGHVTMRLPLEATVHVDRYEDARLDKTIDAYDRRRHARYALPREQQRSPDVFGDACFYGWSEDKAWQSAQPEGVGFSDYLRARFHPGVALARLTLEATVPEITSAIAVPPSPLAAKAPMIKISNQHQSAIRAAAIVLGTLTLYACDSAGAGTGSYPADGTDLGLVQDAMKQVERNYVAPVTSNELARDALKGMLTRLDPHSDYMDQEQYQQMTAVTRGQFGGIGVELTLEGKVPEVISPIDGTPAAEAGIEPGDRIVKIDAQPTTGMDAEEIVKRLRGPAGSRVNLTIARNDRNPFQVSLTRDVIRVVSVKSDLKPNSIGYARITTFTENSASELAAAISRLKVRAQGRLNGFVLDLRNDPGGLLDAAIDVSGVFLDGGVVVATRGRNSADDHVYRAPAAGDLLRGVPVVVLINSASASAAEIVAGALQDHQRATVMGTRSFGKGSVQTIIPLEGRGALRLTTALYYTPSGRSIQGQGISPDIVVNVPKSQQVANAVISFESDLYGALKNGGSLGSVRGANSSTFNRGSAAEAAEHPIKPVIIGTGSDPQVAAALDYLQKAVRREAAPHHG